MMKFSQELLDEKDYMVSIRRHLHKNPELSMKEYKTAEYIEEQLNSMGILHRRIDQTGVLGTIKGQLGNGKTLLLRADIDALPILEEADVPFKSKTPGIMHACGHDIHTAALLGAAKILNSMRSTFSGTILLAFQQAEENCRGSKLFLKENITKDVDRVLGFHVSADYPVGTIGLVNGPVNASCDYFKITIQGKEAHITRPHLGIDALYIGSQIVCRLKALVKEKVAPQDSALIGIGKFISGSTYNIIAKEAVLEGTIRTFSNETQNLLKEEIKKIVKNISEENGATAVCEIETFTRALINDETAFYELYNAAHKILGKENIITDPAIEKGLGSDDFAEYLQDTKGVYAHVGISNDDPATKHSIHDSRFCPDERALLVMSSLHIEYTLAYLKNKNSAV